jgi:hypothetical protein
MNANILSSSSTALITPGLINFILIRSSIFNICKLLTLMRTIKKLKKTRKQNAYRHIASKHNLQLCKYMQKLIIRYKGHAMQSDHDSWQTSSCGTEIRL